MTNPKLQISTKFKKVSYKFRILKFGYCKLFVIWCLVLVIYPSAVSADGLVPCTGIDCSLCDLFSLAQNIFNFVVWDIVPVLAIVMIVWSGYIFLTSGGNPTNVSKGRKMVGSTVIGIAIVYSSYLGASFLIREIAGTTSVANSSFQGNKFLIQCVSNPIPDVTGDFKKPFEIKDDVLLVDDELVPPEIAGAEKEGASLGGVGQYEDVTIDTKKGVDLDGVEPSVKDALKQAVLKARTNDSVDLRVADGYRSLDDQNDLVTKNCKDPKADKCDPKPDHAITCIPKDTDKDGNIDGENCRHTTGKALDVWGYSGLHGDTDKKCCQSIVIQRMKEAGFCVYNKEEWHFELKFDLQADPNRMKVFNCD